MSPVFACARCGAALKPNAKFCGFCGEAVVELEQAAAAAVTKAAPAAKTETETTVSSAPKSDPKAVMPIVPDKSADLPGGATLAPLPATPTSSRRTLVIAAAALAGVLLVAFLGVTIGSAVNNAQDSAPASSDYATTKGAPTPEAPTVTPEAPVVYKTVEFQSISGNIRCRATSDSLICHQGNIKYAAPAASCVTALGGATVGVNRERGFWPCVDAPYTPSFTQPYDVPLEVNGFTCLINLDAGIRCSNAVGSGFAMEFYRGIQLF